MATRSDLTALALAEAARRAQVALRAQMARDVARVWAMLDFTRLPQTWPLWSQAMTALLAGYHAQSADQGALFYRATRQLEVGDPGAVRLASPPAQLWMERALGYASVGTYDKQIRAGKPPEQANKTALTQTLGSSTRIILDGTRTTVADSAHAEGVPWYFKTDGDPCYFCALLASRGPVYKGDSFDISNAQFIGKGTAKVHDHCACIVAPLFKGGRLPALNAQALRVYMDRGEGDALNAFRKAWDAHRAATATMPAAA